MLEFTSDRKVILLIVFSYKYELFHLDVIKMHLF